MNLFTISQLSQYSGIKSHTIRMWEHRYNALKPERSDGNTRYYDNQQLRRLLNIVSMMETSHKVSELCLMPDDKLSGLVLNTKSVINAETAEYYVSQLISAGMNYNSRYFEELFEKCIAGYGVSEAYKVIIYPLLVRVGLMWAGRAIPSAQEHFISNLIRQKILRSIDSLSQNIVSSDKWLLYLPENEYHEIGLLFADYIIRQSGRKVVYLGNSVTQRSLYSAIEDTRPSHILVFMIHYDSPERIQEYLNSLNKRFSGKRICVAGNFKLLNQLSYPPEVTWLKSIEDLEEMVS